MKVIAFSNQKGGVAKTTSTYNIGMALANIGKKVLMIDLDPQASLTIAVGIEPYDLEKSMANVVNRSASIADCVYEINSNLHIAVSTIDLATEELNLISRTSREYILKRAIEPLKSVYDYIMIDCPPNLGTLTVNALTCADGVIIPSETQYFSYRGIELLNNSIADIKELTNPDLEIYGYIATKYQRTNKQKEILEAMMKNYKVLGVCNLKNDTDKGVYDGVPVVEFNPNSDVAMEYVKIANFINENYGE